MTDPVSRTILLLDIEKYSDRDDVEQAYLRRMLYDITDRALESAGIDERLRLRADRGDSVMELIDANASVTGLLRALLTEVPALLRGVNRTASSSAQIRLRGVVATGYVAVDAYDGWVGSDLNHACRLLDAQLLRAALRERPDDFALCVSEGVHAGIVRHSHPGIPADGFHPVTVDSKNGPLRAWLHGPVPYGADDHGERGGTPAPGGSGESPAPGAGAPGPEAGRGTGTGPRTGTEAQAGMEAAEAPGPDLPARTDQSAGPGRTAESGQPVDAGPPDATDRSGRPEPEPESQPEQPAAPPGNVVFNFGGGSPSFGGSLVAGDQHGVSGGQVTGDVHLGRTGGEPA
ncbi:hypothetical protein [Streptomyces rhizosphaerihabitans]|uniref:hypothetical protein n=1 Tax=Streptomyces rhizosphaerihabitans TaxID=1266770 RepID=UPI0021BE41D8|nr:hypothetical protein [Streptomyces rhizosphaerihabitans]MCT9006931.1 hypothetical protein [Streptomyces rhizosphaerihabitans]